MINVEDRVECVEKRQFANVGEKGTVLTTPTRQGASLLIEWDNNVGGHDGGGKGKWGHCEWIGSFYIKFIEEEDKMQDLKIGQVVETREGKKYFVLEDRLISKDSWVNRQSYNGVQCEWCERCDIVKIFNSPIRNNTTCWNFSNAHDELLELVWEEKLFTEEDVSVAKSIIKNYKYIARDIYDSLWVFESKPTKSTERWTSYSCSSFRMFDHLFGAISWEDEEPTLISDIIGGE